MTGSERPLTEAIALAVSRGWRQRVLAYITRAPHELLVFEHPPLYPDAGIQVPAGGVDPGETPAEAVIRETFEETGLRLHSPVHLASFHWTRGENSQVWHYLWLAAPPTTPDDWTHQVTGGETDQGMTFHCRFVPQSTHGLIPGFGYEAALPHLQRLIPAH
ncbi:NUDIX hydrolase [Deinococcus multiflagellatus]|uniref:NUDIX domain-containing protein n=1 Tax=Deinococcus multiflagellatus TaxID=1656887 RepID=A0ABW1ZE54_9DEIO|nr:NUDIX domain-containing protein [Deinococcus multiflagellatus]MBZ9712800.1 NUDIX domain-containing protein [Deinococcus multiflagellatus]